MNNDELRDHFKWVEKKGTGKGSVISIKYQDSNGETFLPIEGGNSNEFLDKFFNEIKLDEECYVWAQVPEKRNGKEEIISTWIIYRFGHEDDQIFAVDRNETSGVDPINPKELAGSADPHHALMSAAYWLCRQNYKIVSATISKKDEVKDYIEYIPCEYRVHHKRDAEIPQSGMNGESDDNGVSTPNQNCPPINRIYYGPPGTGKTYKILQHISKDRNVSESNKEHRVYAKECCKFVTFHQSYGYEEFIEGLRPVLKPKNKSNDDTTHQVSEEIGNNSVASEVQYEISDGVFKELCFEARKEGNKGKRYAIFIDEINRGNISKIFGELITLIEVDKREGMKNSEPVILPYSKKEFSVPANVDIYGTMNSADRSLTVLDTALRRRFEFVECMPETVENNSPIKGLNVDGIEIAKMLEAMNKRLEILLGRDYAIGHAYFMHLQQSLPSSEVNGQNDQLGNQKKEFLSEVFKRKVIPLLQEYFIDDWSRIRLVLADNQVEAKEFQFITETVDPKLFGDENQELDDLDQKKIYRVNDEGFLKSESYHKIYKKIDGKNKSEPS